MTKQKTINNIPEIEKIDENEFVLGGMIQLANTYIEEKCFIFDKKESEDKQKDEKDAQLLIFRVEDQFNQVNKQFLDVDEQCKRIFKKGDVEDMKEYILEFRSKSFLIYCIFRDLIQILFKYLRIKFFLNYILYTMKCYF